jgi:predicted RNA polymerase sigma factor
MARRDGDQQDDRGGLADRVPRLIAGLARLMRDVGVAEELAQDALVAALEQWPECGVPRSPGAWLMAVAKWRAIDQIRRNKRFERKLGELGHELVIDGDAVTPDLDAAFDDHIEATSPPSRGWH